MIRLVLSLALVLGVAALAASPVRAEVAIEVSPSLLELAATPGGEGTQEITVTNTGRDPFEASVAVKPVRSASEAISAVAWLTAEPASFVVEGGAQQIVTVTIDVPSDAESGGRYAIVAITAGAPEQEAAPDGEPQNRAAIAGELGVGFMIIVDGKGKLTRQATIERFAPVLEEDGRIGFLALFRNDGNVHLSPAGAIAVDQADGTPLGSLELDPTTPILPGNDRILSTQGSLPLPLGTSYRTTAVLGFGGPEDEAPVEASAEFTVEPPPLAIAGATVCENLDRGPTLQVEVRNDGDLGALPTVQFSIHEPSGASLGTASLPRSPIAWPNDTTTISVGYPERLESGEYTLVVDAQAVAGEPIHFEFLFRIGGLDGAAPLCPQSDAAEAA